MHMQRNAHQSGRANNLDLNDAYAVKTPQDSRKLYAAWAETYDETFIKANDYIYPRTIATYFHERLATEQVVSVADIGCGTGAVGSYLASLNDNLEIDGFDISPEMLTRAAQLKRIDGSPVYRNLFEVDLTTGVHKREYDAMISAGTFTHGHLGCETLVSLFDLVHPGGWFVVGINAEHFSSQGFASALETATASETISKPELIEAQIYGPNSPHAGDLAKIAMFKRLN